MNLSEALKKLHIEDYSERIFNSNSHGELFHLADYFAMAEALPEDKGEAFRAWFVAIVDFAEKNWQRPESVFQHIPKFLTEFRC